MKINAKILISFVLIMVVLFSVARVEIDSVYAETTNSGVETEVPVEKETAAETAAETENSEACPYCGRVHYKYIFDLSYTICSITRVFKQMSSIIDRIVELFAVL